jgi:hypothetical protein
MLLNEVPPSSTLLGRITYVVVHVYMIRGGEGRWDRWLGRLVLEGWKNEETFCKWLFEEMK